MINLLPPQEKKDILGRRKLKLVLLFEIGILLFLVSLLCTLFFVVIYLSGELETEKLLMAEKSALINLQAFSDSQNRVKVLNREFLDLTSFYKGKPKLTELFERIYARLPEHSYLKNISFVTEAERVKVSLSGFMPTAESLLVFKREMERDKDLLGVTFPAADWTSSKDIDFTLSFELK